MSFIDWDAIDVTLQRDSVFTEYGTTTKTGRQLFYQIQKVIRPIVTDLCTKCRPHEVNLIMSAIVSMETSTYAAYLFKKALDEVKKK